MGSKKKVAKKQMRVAKKARVKKKIKEVAKRKRAKAKKITPVKEFVPEEPQLEVPMESGESDDVTLATEDDLNEFEGVGE